MFSNALLTDGDFSIEGLRAMDLWAQGLFVVIIGLIGVFLVLTLFFVTIVIMQKISDLASRKRKSSDQATEAE